MSNLGGYQKLTIYAKKVGGPGKLVALIAAGGMVAGGIIVKVGEVVLKKGKQVIAQYEKNIPKDSNMLYTIKQDAESNEGLQLKKGTTFRVLESDDDAILIELIGNSDNPYFVSRELLKEISDWSTKNE